MNTMKSALLVLSLIVLSQPEAFARGGHGGKKKMMACEGKTEGQGCNFEGKKGEVEGVCAKSRHKEEVLVCKDPNRKGRKGAFMEKLNLDEDQKSKLKVFMKEHHKGKKELKGDKKDHREKMKELFLANKPDSELLNLHSEISSQMAARGKHRLEKMIFLKNLLNKEQRQAFMELKDQHKGHRGPKKGHR